MANLVTVFQNEVADRTIIAATLKKFQSYRFITLTCAYLNALDKIVPTSNIFKGDALLSFEVKSALKTSKAYLNELLDDEDDTDSHL